MEKMNSMQGQKYFIAYVAYSEAGMDIFNNILQTDEEITNELLVDIQESLKDGLNKETKSGDLYYTAQIINIVKL
jgi:hypothetical protein